MLALDPPHRTVPASTLTAMGQLATNRPTPDAPLAAKAAWYAAKAELHQRCAAEAKTTGRLVEHRHELEYARRAETRADELAAGARLGLETA